MRFLAATICAGLLTSCSAWGSPPPGNLSQLEQLNRANEAALGYLQRPSVHPHAGRGRADMQHRQLDRRQQAEQRWLQERQRRELIMLNERARTQSAPGTPYSLRAIDLQRRFQLQQQQQLDRFRLQRAPHLR